MVKPTSLIIFSLIFLLTACFPTGKQQDSVQPIDVENDGSTPSTINKELDKNLMVKADITSTNNENYKVSSVSVHNFDEDKLKNIFMKNKKIIETHKADNIFKDKSFLSSDGSILTMSLGSIQYRDAFYNNRDYEKVIYGSNYFIRSNLKDVYIETTLDNVNKKDSVEKVRKAVHEAGIDHLGNPEVIALDLKTLQSEWEDYETKQGGSPRKWEKNDEAYVITFPVVYDNLSITNKGYLSANQKLPIIGSRILGVVNKDGLIYLSCSGIYEIKETINDNVKPISLETALGVVKKKYKDILLTDPITISHIALEYVPVASNGDGNNYKLMPSWVFTAKQNITIKEKKGTSKVPTNFSIIINAETGEELRIGGEY